MLARTLSVLLLVLAVLTGCSGDPRRASQEAPGRPNIVFVVADDLAKRDMRALGGFINPHTADGGMLFARAYVTDPVCCPSQASILRGQYPHNTGVVNHNIENGGDAYEPFGPLEGSTLATRLDGAGYETARFGKYLVDWPGDYTPPGWDRFDVWERNTENLEQDGGKYVLDSGGVERTYDADAASPDAVITRRAVGWIRENRGEPMFLYMGMHSPHEEHAYPDRYADEFRGAVPGVTDEADLSDKPGWVRRFALDGPDHAREYRERLRASLVLRDQIARLRDALKDAGELDETYVFFTSDNGYRLGEHRLPTGKRTPYLEDVEVPLHVSGPGIAPGTKTDAIASLADLAPTAASLAGAPVPSYADGSDLSPVLRDPSAAVRKRVLVEGYSEGFANARHMPPTYKTVVSENFSYTEYAGGEKELYNLNRDPDQLDGGGAQTDKGRELAGHLERMRSCEAGGCREAEN